MSAPDSSPILLQRIEHLHLRERCLLCLDNHGAESAYITYRHYTVRKGQTEVGESAAELCQDKISWSFILPASRKVC